MDITHSLQQPGKGGNSGFRMGSFGGVIASGGTRNLIPTIAHMAVVFGVDGIFMEVHDAPSESPCDISPAQWPLDLTSALLTELVGLGRISLRTRNSICRIKIRIKLRIIVYGRFFNLSLTDERLKNENVMYVL